jgi:hypothetical protein
MELCTNISRRGLSGSHKKAPQSLEEKRKGREHIVPLRTSKPVLLQAKATKVTTRSRTERRAAPLLSDVRQFFSSHRERKKAAYQSVALGCINAYICAVVLIRLY